MLVPSTPEVIIPAAPMVTALLFGEVQSLVTPLLRKNR